MASNYPTAVDPEVPTLRDDIDTFRSNGLQHIADMAIAVQGQMGVDMGLVSSLGGAFTKFGNLAQVMIALGRFETATKSFTYDPDNVKEAMGQVAATVNFSFGRFTIPPMVICQTISAVQDPDTSGPTTPSEQGFRESKIFPVNITKSSFGVAMSQRACSQASSAGSGIAIKFHWLAFEPPFGWAEYGDSTTG